jgi:hypothetical protein
MQRGAWLAILLCARLSVLFRFLRAAAIAARAAEIPNVTLQHVLFFFKFFLIQKPFPEKIPAQPNLETGTCY